MVELGPNLQVLDAKTHVLSSIVLQGSVGHDWAVYRGCRVEARLEQRRSPDGDIDEEAVGILQFRLKLSTTELLWKMPGLGLLDWFNM